MYTSIYNFMKSYEKNLEESIHERNRIIRKLPCGHLACFQNRQYFTWYKLSNDNGIRSRTLIPKSKRYYAEQLALREYHESALQTEKKQLRSVRLFLNNFDNHCPGDKYLNSCKEHMNILQNYFPYKNYSKDNLSWMNATPIEKPPHPEELIVSTVLGYNVRSKSESDYVTSLSSHNIVFRYEYPLFLSNTNRTIFPDFTVKHPITDETVYIEHFGKMDDHEYAEKAALKVYNYLREGILPGKNLFLSYETQLEKFSSMDAEEIVKKIFLSI